MTFQRKDITDARVLPNNAKNDSRAPNGNRSGFRTDTAISNSRLGNERTLKAWVPDTGYEVDGSLEKPSGGGGAWDQFAENERLFGLKTDYDENIYTTAIDRSHPQYKERLAAAERKAREIERTVPTTAHVAEERVMDFAGGDDQRDEEDKYSGVRRQDFPPLAARENKYTPPARRAPTGQATVKGAPVDPAIISAQLKSTSPPKQPTPQLAEPKNVGTPEKPATPAAEKPTEVKPAGPAGVANAPEGKADAPAQSKTANTKEQAPTRPSASTVRAPSQAKAGAAMTVERDLLNSFKTFASSQRTMMEKSRTSRAKVDKEVKLTELKKFAESFKLTTPVPKDLISIIAKDPAKQKQIQEKVQANIEEEAKRKETVAKEKEVAATKETRPSVEQSGASASHSWPPPGCSLLIQPQSHYQYNRNNRPPPHLSGQAQPTGNLAQRLRNVEQQKMQHPHMAQHPLRTCASPTGPANSVDPNFGRRISGVPPSYMGPKLNPNSHEFRPNAFAQPFNPAVPSQGSSPRSSVNNIVEAPVPAPPAKGQLIRRKTRMVDVKKCFILSHIETFQPPQGRTYDENDGLKPSFDTLPTWRQLQEETEAPDSTMHLTYKEHFERQPLSNAAVATPNPTHVVPQIPHQHQLPFHLQHGAQNLAPRQSPHMPPMQMHASQHGHVPHVPFSGPDDHRMMHSNSAQSFASPRMGQVPMAYPPAVNA
ncbi:poly(A)-binding protein binding protein [Collariella sp. IMI 366227]|nr:poly(A)-binding protein binding protein [Collariella sp. IMI 366227]